MAGIVPISRKLTRLIIHANQIAEELISIRNEISKEEDKQIREAAHTPIRWRPMKKDRQKVREVMCSCGENTKYRVPLNTIEDFECPKKQKRR